MKLCKKIQRNYGIFLFNENKNNLILFNRDEYLNTLIGVKGIPDIKVITGIWRSGKSKFMETFIA